MLKIFGDALWPGKLGQREFWDVIEHFLIYIFTMSYVKLMHPRRVTKTNSRILNLLFSIFYFLFSIFTHFSSWRFLRWSTRFVLETVFKHNFVTRYVKFGSLRACFNYLVDLRWNAWTFLFGSIKLPSRNPFNGSQYVSKHVSQWRRIILYYEHHLLLSVCRLFLCERECIHTISALYWCTSGLLDMNSLGALNRRCIFWIKLSVFWDCWF